MGNEKNKAIKHQKDSLSENPDTAVLVSDLHQMVNEARTTIASTVNSSLTLLYWKIGQRIHHEVLKGNRAEYGKQIITLVSKDLTIYFGSGFAEKNLRRMVQFSEIFSDEQIVVTLSRQLSWSHFLALLPLEKPSQRDFYAEMCRVQNWSVRTLRQQINNMLYERTLLSKKPDDLIKQQVQNILKEGELPENSVVKDSLTTASDGKKYRTKLFNLHMILAVGEVWL